MIVKKHLVTNINIGPNMSKIPSKFLTKTTLLTNIQPKNKVKAEHIIRNILTSEPINPVMEICDKVGEVKDNAKISNIFSLIQDVYNKGSNFLNFTKQHRDNKSTLGSLIGPLFSVTNFVHLAKSVVSCISADADSVGRAAIDAVDRDVVHIGKKAVEGEAHKAFMDFVLLPELNLVKKYPYFKPILFGNPKNILEIGSQVRQLYKEYYDAEFSSMLKKNTALISGTNPNNASLCANSSKVDDVIYDYVI